MIPKHFIRVWLGPKPIPEMFEDWWLQFQTLHPDFAFTTLRDNDVPALLPAYLEEAWADIDTYAGRSDLLRYLALQRLGGIYVDTDIMPLRPFDDLLLEDTPFVGKRSKVSFANGVIGTPAEHPAWDTLFEEFLPWYADKAGRSASVRTGPAFLSHAWFGRPDVRHIQPYFFYPYNGFGAPKYDERMKMFAERTSFHPDAYCAHFGNHSWGGKPK